MHAARLGMPILRGLNVCRPYSFLTSADSTGYPVLSDRIHSVEGLAGQHDLAGFLELRFHGTCLFSFA
jgi:hypothetical protein